MSRPWKTPKGTELFITDLRGKDYMEVKYRLVWFREERADWSIETDLIYFDDKSAIAKAVIKDSSGRVIATGHKHENTAGFSDFREKAETGAIGRALAHCGYGTQFAPDLEEGERIVDSPTQRRVSEERVVHVDPRQIRSSVPFHCGQPMKVSLFPKDLPESERPYYCVVKPCKVTVAR